MPGRFAAVVPPSKLPVEPNSASEPLDAASRPHFVAPLGDDLSSQMSISSGRPSWHVPLTALTATFVPSVVPVVALPTTSGPERLRIDVILIGSPGHGTVLVVVPSPDPSEDPPLLPHPTASIETTPATARIRTLTARRALTMVPPRPLRRRCPRSAPAKNSYSPHHVGSTGRVQGSG